MSLRIFRPEDRFGQTCPMQRISNESLARSIEYLSGGELRVVYTVPESDDADMPECFSAWLVGNEDQFDVVVDADEREVAKALAKGFTRIAARFLDIADELDEMEGEL